MTLFFLSIYYRLIFQRLHPNDLRLLLAETRAQITEIRCRRRGFHTPYILGGYTKYDVRKTYSMLVRNLHVALLKKRLINELLVPAQST